MPEGTVLWFDSDKGIGFIQTLEGEEFFVHHSSIRMEGFKTLKSGEPVQFEIIHGQRGPEAIHVEKKLVR